MGQAKSPPTPLLELAESALGAPLRWRDRSWDHGESAVWEVASDRGRAIVKHHAHQRKFDQEYRAYREWGPAMAGGVPRLLAVRELPPRGMLLERLPGFPAGVGASGVALASEASRDLPEPVLARHEREIHRSAGAWLARWHALPFRDDDPWTVGEAFAARAEAWLERGRPHLPGRLLDAVRSGIERSLPILAGLRRVPCHRDFTPRNWLVHEGGFVAVIDFEHARPDVELVDVLRLWSACWPERPDLREAFEDGYGRRFAEEDEALMRQLAALDGVATVGWAEEHGDAAFADQGRALLRRLGFRLR